MNIPVPGAFGQRVLIWLGAACAVTYGLSYVFLLKFLAAPDPLMAPADVIALYADHNLMFRFGVGLMILTGAFFVPISIPVSIQIARMEKGFPYLAILQLLTGLMGAWIFAWPAVLWNVCAFTVDRSPDVTVALHQMAWLSFVTPGSFFWMQIGVVGLAALFGRQGDPMAAYPRMFGFFTLFAALEMSVPPTFSGMFWKGPFAWNGILTYYTTIIVYSIWLALTIFFTLRAITRQADLKSR